MRGVKVSPAPYSGMKLILFWIHASVWAQLLFHSPGSTARSDPSEQDLCVPAQVSQEDFREARLQTARKHWDWNWVHSHFRCMALPTCPSLYTNTFRRLSLLQGCTCGARPLLWPPSDESNFSSCFPNPAPSRARWHLLALLVPHCTPHAALPAQPIGALPSHSHSAFPFFQWERNTALGIH